MEPVLHLSLPVADLAAAKAFYVERLGCRVGRQRPGWVDIWFFGLQLTLHEDPEHVLDHQGSRHFGATLDAAVLDDLLTRLEVGDVTWLQRRGTDFAGTPQAQTKAKVVDPSGNVIELKSYADPLIAFDDETGAHEPPLITGHTSETA